MPTTRQATIGKELRFAVDLLRAFGGAMLFSLPMLMTMEMWWLGFYMEPLAPRALDAVEHPSAHRSLVLWGI